MKRDIIEKRAGWDHFFGDVLTWNLSFEALNEPILDRLDIFSDAIDPQNTLVV